MSKERKVGWSIIAIGVLLALLVVGVVVTNEVRSLHYTVKFDDAKNLQPGDKVTLSGVEIGTVKWIKLEHNPEKIFVRLKIRPEHAGQIRSDSTAMIRSVSFPNVSGQKVVEILNPESTEAAQPMSDDMVIEGLDSEIELAAWQFRRTIKEGSEALGKGLDVLGENLKDLGDQLKEMTNSPEAREAMESLQKFMGEMNTEGKKAIDRLEQEWPKLQQEIEPLLKQLSDFGREFLVEQLRSIMDQIDRTLRQWRKEQPQQPGMQRSVT